MPKTIAAEVNADSISPAGIRIVSLLCTLPRFILAEFNTHRALSRNSASSRAIPVKKMIRMVEDDPFVPVVWTTAQKGMQGGPPLTGRDVERARKEWLDARDDALVAAERLEAVGLHKQVVNRVLEPYMWHTLLVTATEWGNFMALRNHEAAEPHFRILAECIYSAIRASKPRELKAGEWHIPFGEMMPEGATLEDQIRIATGRSARTSYMTHGGEYAPAEDIRLHDDLIEPGHMSPTEHCAQAMEDPDWSGNFYGWRQYRKTLPRENRPDGFLGYDARYPMPMENVR